MSMEEVDIAPEVFHVRLTSQLSGDLLSSVMPFAERRMFSYCPLCCGLTSDFVCPKCLNNDENISLAMKRSQYKMLVEKRLSLLEKIRTHRHADVLSRDEVSLKHSVLKQNSSMLYACRSVLFSAVDRKRGELNALKMSKGKLFARIAESRGCVHKLNALNESLRARIAQLHLQVEEVESNLISRRNQLMSDLFLYVFPTQRVDRGVPGGVSELAAELAQAALTSFTPVTWPPCDLEIGLGLSHSREAGVSAPDKVRILDAEVVDSLDFDYLKSFLTGTMGVTAAEQPPSTVDVVLGNRPFSSVLASMAHTAQLVSLLALLADVILPFTIGFAEFRTDFVKCGGNFAKLECLSVKLRVNVCFLCLSLISSQLLSHNVTFTRPLRNMLDLSERVTKLGLPRCIEMSDELWHEIEKSSVHYLPAVVSEEGINSREDWKGEAGRRQQADGIVEGEEDWESLTSVAVPEWRDERMAPGGANASRSVVNTLLTGTASSVSQFWKAMGGSTRL